MSVFSSLTCFSDSEQWLVEDAFFLKASVKWGAKVVPKGKGQSWEGRGDCTDCVSSSSERRRPVLTAAVSCPDDQGQAFLSRGCECFARLPPLWFDASHSDEVDAPFGSPSQFFVVSVFSACPSEEKQILRGVAASVWNMHTSSCAVAAGPLWGGPLCLSRVPGVPATGLGPHRVPHRLLASGGTQQQRRAYDMVLGAAVRD